MTIDVQVLGGLRVLADGYEIDDLMGRPTCLAVLVFIAVERRVTRESVLGLLWPDREETRARHALSQTLYQLRRILGTDWVERHGQELRLARDVRVDVGDFTDALERRSLDAGITAYRGRFLEGWRLHATAAFEHWVDRQAQRLTHLYRDACQRSIAAYLAGGDRTHAIEVARLWTAAEPTGSAGHRALIELLIADGQYEAARECYAVLEARLAEWGMVPSAEVVAASAPVRTGPKAPLPAAAEGPPTSSAPRIAVLPFAHAGPAEFGHLTDALADETTVRLSRHPGVAVTARSSTFRFTARAQSPIEIGKELQVDYVLDGAVRWRRGGSVVTAVVSPQVLRVRDGRQVWAAELEIDRQGVADAHLQLARRTLAVLGLPPLPGPGGAGPADPRDARAYELYLRGLQHWHQRSPAGLAAAIDLFIQAIELDQGYARAYGGLALAYAMMPSFLGESSAAWIGRARRAAARALDLDADVVEGHMAMGVIAWSHDLDAAVARQHWDRTLALQPSNPSTLLWQAYRAAAQQRADEARRLVGEALALDPLSVATNFDAGYVSWCLRDQARSLAQLRRVQQIDPAFSPAAFLLGADHLQRAELEDARREWSRIRMFGPSWLAVLEHLDDPTRAATAVDRIVELSPRPVYWYAAASLYILFGAPERALFWLETHLQNLRGEAVKYPTGGPSLFHIATDPIYDALRSHPRFRTLIRTLRLDAPPV